MNRFRSHILKKILGALVIVGCSGIFLNGYVGVGETVHAQGTQTTTVGTTPAAGTAATTPAATGAEQTKGLREMLNIILKLIYLLLWPLLVVAGISLDNTLVYASIFHLDAPLWKFWNIMKNFANFTLGFMVLFAILKGFFTQKNEKGPMDVIKKTLIAGILIQASRFLMAALVDVSTIATYAVGGLPLSVLKNTDIGKQKILMVNSVIDLDKFTVFAKKGEGFDVRYSATFNDKPIKISSCRVEKSRVIGREMMSPEYINSDKFGGNGVDARYKDKEICILFGSQLVFRDEKGFLDAIPGHRTTSNLTEAKTGRKTSEGHYSSLITAFINQSGWQNTDTGWISSLLVNIETGGTNGISIGSDFKQDPLLVGTTISNIINKSKGFVGPLVMMYSSLLNFAELSDTSVTSSGETSGIFIIKTGIAIALFFPLLALALVLVARIGLLWLYIAASPFLILKKVFGDVIPKIGEKFDKHLELGNVIKLIFAPVVTVAALSISLIFMTALIDGFKAGDNKQMSSDLAQNLDMIPTGTGGNQSFLVGGAAELEFTQLDWGGTLDRFSRLIVNFFAIALLWTIVFAAIKANALGAEIGQKVQDFGSQVFQTMPVLPFGPGGERVGIGAAFDTIKARPEERVAEKKRDQLDIAKKWFDDEETKQNATLNDTQFNEVFSKIQTVAAGTGTVAEKQKAINDYLVKQKITSTVPDIAKANATKFYESMNKIQDTDQRKIIFETVPEMKTEYNALAKADIATKVVNTTKIPEATAVGAVNPSIFTDATNKEILDNYFSTTTDRTYTTLLGTTKQVTITAAETAPGSSVFTYTGTITAVTPPPVNPDNN